MSPESSAKSKKPQENAGKEILTALSQQEVALWLDALWASLPADSRERALNRMPRDTRETLQQLLRESQDPKVKTKTKTGAIGTSWFRTRRSRSARLRLIALGQVKPDRNDPYFSPRYFKRL